MKKKSEEDQVWDQLSPDTIQGKSGKKAARFPQYSGDSRILKIREKLDKHGIPDNATLRSLVSDEIEGRAEGRAEGTASMIERSQIYQEELFNFVVSLLKKEPALCDGPNAQIAIAKKVCTQEASNWSTSHKSWNRRSKKANAPFYSLRRVRGDVKDILTEAMKAAGIEPRKK